MGSSAAAGTEPAPRLAASQLRRMHRIEAAAVELAARGGYEAVRLREVADASRVALGTLYRYFPSKDHILLHALNQELVRLEARLATRPPRGASALDRVAGFFLAATRGLTLRPELARAYLRAVVSGAEGATIAVAGFHLRTTRMLIAALDGRAPDPARPLDEPVGTPRDRQLALTLEQVWFAALVGWAGGLHPIETVGERVREAAALLLAGDSRRRSVA